MVQEVVLLQLQSGPMFAWARVRETRFACPRRWFSPCSHPWQLRWKHVNGSLHWPRGIQCTLCGVRQTRVLRSARARNALPWKQNYFSATICISKIYYLWMLKLFNGGDGLFVAIFPIIKMNEVDSTVVNYTLSPNSSRNGDFDKDEYYSIVEVTETTILPAFVGFLCCTGLVGNILVLATILRYGLCCQYFMCTRLGYMLIQMDLILTQERCRSCKTAWMIVRQLIIWIITN